MASRYSKCGSAAPLPRPRAAPVGVSLVLARFLLVWQEGGCVWFARVSRRCIWNDGLPARHKRSSALHYFNLKFWVHTYLATTACSVRFEPRSPAHAPIGPPGITLAGPLPNRSRVDGRASTPRECSTAPMEGAPDHHRRGRLPQIFSFGGSTVPPRPGIPLLRPLLRLTARREILPAGGPHTAHRSPLYCNTQESSATRSRTTLRLQTRAPLLPAIVSA